MRGFWNEPSREEIEKEGAWRISDAEVYESHRTFHPERKILVASDDVQSQVLLSEVLCAHGYSVAVTNISMACQAAECDVIILDATVGWNSGRLFRKPRAASDAWILVISGEKSLGQSPDLEHIADVMLTAPFDQKELLIILRGILQERARWQVRSTALHVGPFRLEPGLNSLMIGEKEVALTEVESRVLHELMVNAGNVVRRERLISQGLGREWSAFDRCLDRHIHQLRGKIGRDLRGCTPIRTVRALGYMLVRDWRPAPARGESGQYSSRGKTR